MPVPPFAAEPQDPNLFVWSRGFWRKTKAQRELEELRRAIDIEHPEINKVKNGKSDDNKRRAG